MARPSITPPATPGGSVNATLVGCPHQAAAATGAGSTPAAPPWGLGLQAAAYRRRLLPPSPAALAAATAASLAALPALVQTAAAAWASARAEAGWIWATRAGQSARAASAPCLQAPTQAPAGCQAETRRLLFPLLPAIWQMSQRGASGTQYLILMIRYQRPTTRAKLASVIESYDSFRVHARQS